MLTIDAHAHFAGDHPKTLQWMESADVKILNICVGRSATKGPVAHADQYRQLAKDYPARYAWCTSIDLPGFDDPQYAEKTIETLKGDFENGAVGCKVWKSIGMQLKRPDGKFVQIDDPIFEPIFSYIEQAGKTLIMHMAEALDCWRPLDEKNTMRTYYTNNPQWHMYGKDEYPHHSEIIAARDNVVARYPSMRVVGAHLGSLEHDVKEIAQRLAAYPNFAVDTCGPSRIVNLAQQDRGQVRQFFIDYQDRIMFGSDVQTGPQLEMSEQQLDEVLETLRKSFQIGWDYYGTDKKFAVKGWDVHGLDLPKDVQEKLFCTNPPNWFPGF